MLLKLRTAPWRGSALRIRALGPTRGLFKGAKDFVKEWREMNAANQPMPDPHDTPKERDLRDFLSLGIEGYFGVFRETLSMYKLTLFDREEAIRQLKIEAEIKRQMEEIRLRSEGAAMQSPDGGGGHRPDAATDMAELADRVRKMFPKDVQSVKNVDDAVRLASDRREDIEKLAADRMELLGHAIFSFMEGYRDGKEKSRSEVEAATDPYLERLMSPFMPAAAAPAASCFQQPSSSAHAPVADQTPTPTPTPTQTQTQTQSQEATNANSKTNNTNER